MFEQGKTNWYISGRKLSHVIKLFSYNAVTRTHTRTHTEVTVS